MAAEGMSAQARLEMQAILSERVNGSVIIIIIIIIIIILPLRLMITIMIIVLGGRKGVRQSDAALNVQGVETPRAAHRHARNRRMQ